MKIKIATKSGKVVLDQIEVQASDKVEILVKAIHSKFPKYSPERQRLTFSGPNGDLHVLDKSSPLSKYGLKDGDTITFKDLGPQIGWRTVFLIEYFGPILIHPLVYYASSWNRSTPVTDSYTQQLAMWMFVAHFIKREVETVFVHRFSNATMPFRNLPKNCFHYWVLGGLLVAYPLYQPTSLGTLWTPLAENSAIAPYLIGAWVLAQLSNGYCHIILRNLRPPGTKVRKIPRGFTFELVSCPNYFYEVVGWSILTALTGSAFLGFFTVVGAVQMYIWAQKKHSSYKKDFPDYPKGRKAMFPFFL